MEDKLIHIDGPIYIVLDNNDTPYFDRQSHQLSPEWLEEYFSALGELTTQLPGLIKNHSPWALSIHAKLGNEWISDGFYDCANLTDDHKAILRRFIDCAIDVTPDTRYEEMLWESSESHLGQFAIAWLAENNLSDVRRFIRYMEACDLDHEVGHGAQFEAIVKAHGWTPETVALWVARNGTCSGQHGREASWNTPQGDTLEDWMGGDASRFELVTQLIGGNILADFRWTGDIRYGLDHIFAVIDDDILDIFFNPKKLSKLGLGESAEAVVNNAGKWAKVAAERHFKEGTEPDYWLDALT